MGESPVDLSYYIEKKLKRPLMLHGFIHEQKFTQILKQHGLRVSGCDLEVFEREGWLQPAFRLHRKILPSGQAHLVDPYGLQQHYRGGNIEFPQVGDYKPWSSFKPKVYESGQHLTDIYYHKYQLLQVHNILEHKTFHTLCRNPENTSDQEIINSTITQTSINMGSFKSSYNRVTKITGMSILLEERYMRPSSIPWFLDRDHVNNLLQEMHSFSASDMLKDAKFSIEEVCKMRDWLSEHAEYMDPVSEWYDLIRIMRYDVLRKIQGPIHTTQLYYNIVRMLKLFINDLEDSSEPDTPFNANYVERRKQLYKVTTLDYNKHDIKKAIIEYYIQGSTTKLYLLVEGDSEEKVIKEIVKQKKLPYFNDYVEIFNCKGAKNMTHEKIQHIIQAARRDSTPVYLIGDNENAWKDHLKFLHNELEENFNYTIWKTSFEEDNFGSDNVIRFINLRLQKNGKFAISNEEIAEQQQNGMGLVNAMVKVYGDKQGKFERRSLFQAIGIMGNKSDLALELLDDAYKRDIQDELKIEKIIRHTSDLIRIWP